MLKAEMLSHELEECEQRMAGLDEQRAQAEELADTLVRFEGLKGGERLLVPLATGIFAHATCSGETELLVNVGDGILVPKSTGQVHAQVHAQLASIALRQDELHARFDALLAQLDDLKERFSE